MEPEIAATFSSGGFSDIFERPQWQQNEASRYLSGLGPRLEGLFNPGGRGFPDVAAQAHRFHIFDRDADITASGTSAAAPTFAGLVHMVNNARMRDGRAPMGFLNPWLYSLGRKALTE